MTHSYKKGEWYKIYNYLGKCVALAEVIGETVGAVMGEPSLTCIAVKGFTEGNVTGKVYDFLFGNVEKCLKQCDTCDIRFMCLTEGESNESTPRVYFK